jgi:beta-glucosidase
MAAYNAWNGIPMTVNPVLKDVVAKEWGANWVISSDAGAMGHVINYHKYLKTPQEVMAAAVKLGMNQFLGGGTPDIIRATLDQKLMTEAELSEAIKGKLRTTVKLGLLDPPAMVPYTKIGAAGETEPWNGEKHKGVARQVARESVVLLKNTGLLPLNKQAVKSIAVVGNRAEEVLFDMYSGTTPYAISVLEGVKEKVGGGIRVNYAAEGEAAVNAAKTSDVAVVVVGNHPICGGRGQGMFNPDASSKPCAIPSEGREGRDREAIGLPTEELIKQVYAANPKTIVVLIASFPYAIDWSQENVPAILHITHTAQEQGTAIADVLFGDYNPAGRLVQTWPKSLDQVPPIMDYDLRHGRTYLYFKGQPLYPFGYGLSYTKFDYSNLRLSSAKLAKNGAIAVSVDVKNTGKLAGDEVLQMYVEHPKSQVARPLKELKGFQRITLKPGEKKTVRIALTAQSLAWWNEKQKAWEVEAEPIGIQIGSSSADIRLKKDATVD